MSTTSSEQLADVTGIDESAVSHGQNTKSVYVYAVSYTHLDVYKRQVEANADKSGGTAAGGVGAWGAAHAAISVAKRAKDKAAEKKASPSNT